LPRDFEVRDFDDGGWYDSGRSGKWNTSKTKFWIAEGKRWAKEDKSLIIAGFCNPKTLEEIAKETGDKAHLILLDADSDTIKKRLAGRFKNQQHWVEKLERAEGKSLNEFIEQHASSTDWFRGVCKDHNCEVVDTLYLSIEEVANKVAKILKNKIREKGV
jgi:5S rRNA maturation endonuclease (ribonuclease M5)